MIRPDDSTPERAARHLWFAQWGISLGLLVHLMLFGVETALGAHTAAGVTLACALGMAGAGWCARRGAFRLTVLIVWGLVVIREPVASGDLGWASGQALYFAVLPQVLFLHLGLGMRARVGATLALVAWILWRSAHAFDAPARIALEPQVVHGLFAMNLALVVLIVSVLALLTFASVRRLEAELSDLAATDVLTGLPNRRSFSLAMEALVRESNRDGTRFVLGLLDVDHFKRINDVHGHSVGDEVLIRCGAVLRTDLKAGDRVFRWGGEEFAIVLRDSDLERAHIACDRLRARLQDELSTVREGVTLTVTVGLAQWSPGESLDALFRRADAALYAGKDAGRDRTVSVADGGGVVAMSA